MALRGGMHAKNEAGGRMLYPCVHLPARATASAMTSSIAAVLVTSLHHPVFTKKMFAYTIIHSIALFTTCFFDMINFHFPKHLAYVWLIGRKIRKPSKIRKTVKILTFSSVFRENSVVAVVFTVVFDGR